MLARIPKPWNFFEKVDDQCLRRPGLYLFILLKKESSPTDAAVQFPVLDLRLEICMNQEGHVENKLIMDLSYITARETR